MHTLDLQQHSFAHQQRVGLCVCWRLSQHMLLSCCRTTLLYVHACMLRVCKSDAERRERPAATYSEKGAQRLARTPPNSVKKCFSVGWRDRNSKLHVQYACVCVCACVFVPPAILSILVTIPPIKASRVLHFAAYSKDYTMQRILSVRLSQPESHMCIA